MLCINGVSSCNGIKEKSDDDDIIATDNDSRVNVEGTDDLWPDYPLPILYNYTGRVSLKMYIAKL